MHRKIADWLSPLNFKLIHGEFSKVGQKEPVNGSSSPRNLRIGVMVARRSYGVLEFVRFLHSSTQSFGLIDMSDSGCWKDNPRVCTSLMRVWKQFENLLPIHSRSIIINYLQTFFKDHNIAVMYIYCKLQTTGLNSLFSISSQVC